MPKGYWICHIDVRNADNYPDYLKAAKTASEQYGAKVLVRGGEYETVEGASRSRHVVIEFENYERALACYHSPEYQKAAEIRRLNSTGDIIIVKGA
ncbi:MAG: DUF1330 domain-containing protein [Pseudomonadota bacterium]